MSRQQLIFKNPLLTNPNKWLKDVPKKHCSDLLQNQYYNREELETNSYVQSLIKTDANSINTVLPMGNAIRLSEIKDEKIKNVIKLKPNITEINEPTRLISNNKKYIQSILQSKKIVSKYRPFHPDKQFSKVQIEFVENIVEKIDQLYRDEIEKYMGDIKKGEGDGIKLTEGETKWDGETLNVNKSAFNMKEDLFITFKENPILSQLIIRYIDYKGL
ncbi:hypothetical protein KGF54_005061 [Candida jiufengensis]|uniref:uncharacterized protein n=1 Tax=Candida jiufengensis TaxID=497108 RepID=UPI0022240360|nr:uncharacterized protein KGF54_005061 [Candida jiufengensis]KAI5951986.1 hypothetical protein KGF54_005061 [Candida jiufengensis]